MFCSAAIFNQELNFDTKKVNNMTRMFSYTKEFNKKLLWNTTNVINMQSLFSNAIKFNQELNWDRKIFDFSICHICLNMLMILIKN